MNTSNNSNDGLKPVVVDFQNYVGKKPGFKKACKGCSYPFKPKSQNECFCDQCSDGRNVYRNMKATQALLASGGDYGYH